MNVHEESIRAPSAHLPDLDIRATIEMHGHCSTSSKRMATDITFLIAKVKQAKAFGSMLESFVDVSVGDIAVTVISQVIGVDT
jgi:hypothetical protein